MHAASRQEFAPPPQGLLRAYGLALLIHGLLLAALTWGVNWRSSDTSLAVEAELWSAVPQEAAPKLVEPEPEPQPRPPRPAPPKVETPQANEAEIALARERERKAKEKLEQERLERERQAREKKLAEEKKKKELEAKRKDEAETRQREKLRQENLKRMAGLAGATGAPASTGTAQKSSGPSAGYAGKIVALVKAHTQFSTADPSVGRPVTVVIVRVAFDGTIMSQRIVTPSGNALWDEAVLSALTKIRKIPKDVDGTIPDALMRDGLELKVGL